MKKSIKLKMRRNVDIRMLKKKILVRMKDGHCIVGPLICFDRHMNLMLDSAVERRRNEKKELTEQRQLDGVIMIKGAQIVSVTCLEELKEFEPDKDIKDRRDRGRDRSVRGDTNKNKDECKQQ